MPSRYTDTALLELLLGCCERVLDTLAAMRAAGNNETADAYGEPLDILMAKISAVKLRINPATL